MGVRGHDPPGGQPGPEAEEVLEVPADEPHVVGPLHLGPQAYGEALLKGRGFGGGGGVSETWLRREVTEGVAPVSMWAYMRVCVCMCMCVCVQYVCVCACVWAVKNMRSRWCDMCEGGE